MFSKKSALYSIVLASCLFAGAAASAQDVRTIADKVDRHYNNLRSMRAEFAETYKGGGMARNETGVMWLKKPGKMRWDYKTPREKLFVTDGNTAWFYVPGERQARRAPVKKLDDLRSPLRYMLGKTKLMKEFDALSIAPDVKPSAPGNVVLRGVPKGMEDQVSQVLLEVTPDGRFSRIYFEELDGSSTEFRFLQQQDNVEVSDAQFRFAPPRGVETMEATELAPQ